MSRKQPPARMPGDVYRILNDLAARLPILLDRNLFGIYLYGSLTQRAFNPARSDIDCIVITRRKLSDSQFKRVRSWLSLTSRSNPYAPRLQISFLIKDAVLTSNSAACLYQFGKLKRVRSDGNPIIWVNVLKSGQTLCGPPPESFVPPITRELLSRALVREVGYLHEELIEKPNSEWRDVPFYRRYAAVTVCRILYTARKGAVVSKTTAAKWAIAQLPKRWSAIIRQAQQSERPIRLDRLRRFVRFAEDQLQSIFR
jgi:aminoglycoside adenylyltransferase-like protein